MEWNLEPPPDSHIRDRDILPLGKHLEGKRIALMISGSIAAYRCPDLVRDLRREGAEVQVYATSEGLRYVSREALEWNSLKPIIDKLTPEAEHLNEKAAIDAYVVAPASYSVINKTAFGIADTVVTSTLASALGRLESLGTPILFAPAMHGSMHNRILTDSLQRLIDLGVCMIPPRQSHGKNNMALSGMIVAFTIRAMSRSRLRNRRLLITGGPTPVPLDSIRSITTRFTGELANELAREAWYRGADVQLLLGQGSFNPPEFVEATVVEDFQSYRSKLLTMLEKHKTEWGIFTAAVADYEPENVHCGKWPSFEEERRLILKPTPKVIDEVEARFQELNMVPFKYEERVSHEELMSIARGRLESGRYRLLVANRGDEFIEAGEQVAWFISPNQDPQRVVGKPEIASALLDRIESIL